MLNKEDKALPWSRPLLMSWLTRLCRGGEISVTKSLTCGPQLNIIPVAGPSQTCSERSSRGSLASGMILVLSRNVYHQVYHPIVAKNSTLRNLTQLCQRLLDFCSHLNRKLPDGMMRILHSIALFRFPSLEVGGWQSWLAQVVYKPGFSQIKVKSWDFDFSITWRAVELKIVGYHLMSF